MRHSAYLKLRFVIGITLAITVATVPTGCSGGGAGGEQGGHGPEGGHEPGGDGGDRDDGATGSDVPFESDGMSRGVFESIPLARDESFAGTTPKSRSGSTPLRKSSSGDCATKRAWRSVTCAPPYCWTVLKWSTANRLRWRGSRALAAQISSLPLPVRLSPTGPSGSRRPDARARRKGAAKAARVTRVRRAVTTKDPGEVRRVAARAPKTAVRKVTNPRRPFR